MKVKDLIKELQKYNTDLPICINDYMSFSEAAENTIKIEKKEYITFPFTETDKFIYISLKSTEE